MRSSNFSLRSRQLPLVGLLLGITSLLSACGGGGPSAREYALPVDFCGVEVAAELYEPFFPPGSDLEQRGNLIGAVPAGLNCSYRVDGETVVMSGTSGDSEFDDFLGSESLDYSVDDAQAVAGRYEALVWPDLVLAKAPCTVGNEEYSIIDSFMIGVQAQHIEDGVDSQRTLGKFVQSYLEALLEQIPCAEYSDE